MLMVFIRKHYGSVLPRMFIQRAIHREADVVLLPLRGGRIPRAERRK